MAIVKSKENLIYLKILYLGCKNSGKTTSLQSILKKTFKSNLTAKMSTIKNLYTFKFLPLNTGKHLDWNVITNIYIPPNLDIFQDFTSIFFNGIDGYILTVDSDEMEFFNNLKYFHNLMEKFKNINSDFNSSRNIVQYNKRDLKNAISIKILKRHFSYLTDNYTETIATKGIGTLETLNALISQILQNRGNIL